MIYKTLKKVSDYCQILDKSKFSATQTINGVTFTNNGDGSITVNGTASSKAIFTLVNTQVQISRGSKFCLNKPLDTEVYGKFWFEMGMTFADGITHYKADTENSVIEIKRDNVSKIIFYIAVGVGYTVNNITFKPQLFDLTEMYGAGNEPTTVEQFRTKFPNELYDYKPYCFVKSYKNCLTCTTKNLFDIPLVQGYPSNTEPYDNTTLRTFTFGTYIIGMTRNNYYIPSRIDNVNISKNSISFKTAESGWGVSVPFLLTVGKTYTVSCKADNNFYPAIGITYYKENGTLISFTDSEIITNNPVKSFTVPENTYYTLILFYGRTGNEYTFSNLQLEEGSTSTDFVPNGYIQSYKKSLVCKTKNLFDINSAEKYSGVASFQKNRNQIIVSRDTKGFYISANISLDTSFVGKTITVTALAKTSGINNTQIRIQWLKDASAKGKMILSNKITGNYFQKLTLTGVVPESPAEDYNILGLMFYSNVDASLESGVTYSSTFTDIMIELGDTATEYHPYGYL